MTDNRGLFRRVLDAMIEGRRQQTERRVQSYLKRLGLDDPRRGSDRD